MSRIKLIERFVDDVKAAGIPEPQICVYMNAPAIARRWHRVKRMEKHLWFRFGGFACGYAVAVAIDELGNAFALFGDGARRQYLRGEKIEGGAP